MDDQRQLPGENALSLQPALVMGLSASVFRFMVPHELTWDLRIGLDYIRKRAQEAFRTGLLDKPRQGGGY